MGKHGAYVEEQKTEQEFNISVRLAFDTKKAGLSDNLVDTVDYQNVKDIIQQTIEGKTHYLIEMLAEEIATKVLEEKRITSVEVTIKKMEIWDNGIPGVTITRSN